MYYVGCESTKFGYTLGGKEYVGVNYSDVVVMAESAEEAQVFAQNQISPESDLDGISGPFEANCTVTLEKGNIVRIERGFISRYSNDVQSPSLWNENDWDIVEIEEDE